MSRQSSMIIVSGRYEVPADDSEGERILRDLIASVEDSSENSNPIEWMDVYFKHRIDTFFQQGYDTLGDLRQMTRSIRIRDQLRNFRPHRNRRAIRFLRDICDRYEKDGSETVILKMDEDLGADGRLKYKDSWLLWNQFCHYIRKLQSSEAQYSDLFGEIDSISPAMMDQFYADVGSVGDGDTGFEEDSTGEDNSDEDDAGEDDSGEDDFWEDGSGAHNLGEAGGEVSGAGEQAHG